MTTNSSLLIDGNRGIYIPKFFAENYTQYLTNKDEVQDDLSDLSDPENEFYWDAWDNILNNAKLKDDEGRECALYQDGDLWAIPVNEFNELGD